MPAIIFGSHFFAWGMSGVRQIPFNGRLCFCAILEWDFTFWSSAFDPCYKKCHKRSYNIPCFLLKFCQCKSFGIIHCIHSLGKIFLLTLRGLFERLGAPLYSQKGNYTSKTKLKKMTPILLELRVVCSSVLVNVRDIL